MPALRFLNIKEVYPEGDIIKAIAWKVPRNKDFPEGIKYAFAYIHQGKRIFGYDNERAKGHHRHFVDMKTGRETEQPIVFTKPLKLFRTFRKEALAIREKIYVGKNEG